MKKNSLTKWLSLAAVSALTLLAGTAPQAQAAAFDSPVGAWDFTLSGKAHGIAQVTFNADGTIDGYVQRYTTKTAPSSNNPRGGSDGTRNTPETNGAPAAIMNHLGDATIEGRWSFDERGKILGYLNEGGFVFTSSSTNASTNSITFRGVVSLGANPRVTLQGSGSLGKVTYSGIPDAPLFDIGGNYTATGQRGDTKVVEFFTLTSQGGNNNSYDVSQGSSSGFSYGGIALLSGRKQLSMLATNVGNSAFRLTILVGSIKTNTAKASVRGRDSVSGTVTLRTFPTPP